MRGYEAGLNNSEVSPLHCNQSEAANKVVIDQPGDKVLDVRH